MKIKIKTIYYFIVCLLILIDYNFFYIFNLPSWFTYIASKSNKTLIVVMVFLLFLDAVINRQNYLWKYRYSIRYSFILIIAVGIVSMYTIMYYSAQGISSTLRIALPYLIPLLSLPILYLIESGFSWRKILKPIEIFTFIWFIISIIQYFFYSRTGISFLVGFFSEKGILVRDETIRMTMFSFGNIAAFYCLYKLLDKELACKKKVWYALNMALSVFCIILVQKTRLFYLADFVCMILVVFLTGKLNRKKFGNIVLVIIIIAIFVGSGTASDFIQSITSGSEVYNYNSTYVRLGAWGYYFKSFLNNPFCALGFVSDGVYPTIAHGTTGTYNFSDVGFVGLLAQTGLFSIIFFIIPVVRMIFVSVKIINYKLVSEYSMQIVLTVYVLITSISIIITAPAYALALPFIEAYTEYVWISVKEQRYG